MTIARLPVLVLLRVLVPVLVPVLVLVPVRGLVPGASVAAQAHLSAAPTPAEVDRLIDDAYEATYNLDHDIAAELARKAAALAPESSRAHRAVASVLWVKMIYLRGAVTIDYYLGGVTRKPEDRPKPPPALDAELRKHLERAIALAEAALERNPDDVNARSDVGAAYAMQASYVASVEGSMTAAFRSAKRAFDAQEAVLERDPRHSDAAVVVGTYRYLISALSLPTRMFAYIAGFGGGKERGISMLEAATADPRSVVDGGTALMLIYSREGRHRDAMAIAERLAATYPRNRLFLLEAGAAAVRAGLGEKAEAILTRGLERFEEDTRPKFPGERAFWYLKRGLARLAQNHQPGARADFDEALASKPEPWIEGRTRIQLGKLHDLAGRRDAALAEYRRAKELCRNGDDALGVKEAGELERRPFRFENNGR